MRAVAIMSPGGPEMLRLKEVPDPRPGPGHVVVDVVAAGVNHGDLLQRQGRYPPPPGAPPYPGLECSGVISAVGQGVRTWRVGERVCALLDGGGYAERVRVRAGQLLPIPAGVDLVSAAALPEAACVTWNKLVTTAGLHAGETVLVHGGASGIGTFAIQLGRALGARVAVTAGSPAKLDRCAELGAEILVNHRGQDFVAMVREATGGRGADVVLDFMGAVYLNRNIEVLAPGGRLMIIGLRGGRRVEVDLAPVLSKGLTVNGSLLRQSPPAEKAAVVADARRHVWPLIAAGEIRPVVHTTLPLDSAAEAHRIIEASSHVGKVLLTTGWQPGD